MDQNYYQNDGSGQPINDQNYNSQLQQGNAYYSPEMEVNKDNKKQRGIIAAVVGVIGVIVFGVLGLLLGEISYAIILKIVDSKMNTTGKVVLSILVVGTAFVIWLAAILALNAWSRGLTV